LNQTLSFLFTFQSPYFSGPIIHSSNPKHDHHLVSSSVTDLGLCTTINGMPMDGTYEDGGGRMDVFKEYLDQGIKRFENVIFRTRIKHGAHSIFFFVFGRVIYVLIFLPDLGAAAVLNFHINDQATR
jgi:hypothetical protein